MWPGVHRGWRLPRPRYVYQDINGHKYKQNNRPHYRHGSQSTNFGTNVYQYISQITNLQKFNLPRSNR